MWFRLSPKRLVYNQLYEYLNDRNLLSKCQSGFRPLHFMLYALLDATTEWFSNLDQGQINSVAFLDLSKAFDTVDHSVLPQKLALYGVGDIPCKWFKSYLTDRGQLCCVNRHLSSPRKIACGVPPGSILSPLLFLLYINDLPSSLPFSTPRMYVDDTSMTTSGLSVNRIIHSVNSDLNSVRDWLLANKLSLNVSKTEQIFIGSDSNLSKIEWAPQVFMDGIPIKRLRLQNHWEFTLMKGYRGLIILIIFPRESPRQLLVFAK